MKKSLILLFILTLSITKTYADSLDRALDASARNMNANTVYSGVNTAAGVANTVSNVQTNASIRRNIDAQTKLLKKQAALEGIDITDAKDVQNEHMKLYFESRYFLIHEKRRAKYENDQEMLKLIKKYWKPWTTTDAIYAAEKVQELKEKREKEKEKAEL